MYQAPNKVLNFTHNGHIDDDLDHLDPTSVVMICRAGSVYISSDTTQETVC